MKTPYIPPRTEAFSFENATLLSESSGNPTIDTGGDSNPDVSDKSESQSGGRAKMAGDDIWGGWE